VNALTEDRNVLILNTFYL